MNKIRRESDSTESEYPEFEKVSPEGFEGMHIVRNKGVPDRAREDAGRSRYPIGKLNVGDSISSRKASDIRNARVAANTWAKRQAANGGEKPTFVTRKERSGLYSLIRKS